MIIGTVFIAVVGSGVTQVFLLGHKITSVNPNALRAGTSLLAQGVSSNRMQYASLATDKGETKPAGKNTKLSFDTLGGWTYIEGKTPIPDDVKSSTDRKSSCRDS